MRSRGFKRALGSIVAASAAVVGLVVMTPATASAAPAILPPPGVGERSGQCDHLHHHQPEPAVQLHQLHSGDLNARDVPDVIRDPTKLLQPGVLVYPTVSNILDLFAVSPGQTITRTVGNLPAGVYAVAGACVRLLDPTNPLSRFRRPLWSAAGSRAPEPEVSQVLWRTWDTTRSRT